jgi:hypothetical protein
VGWLYEVKFVCELAVQSTGKEYSINVCQPYRTLLLDNILTSQRSPWSQHLGIFAMPALLLRLSNH